jgi:hypothetical protein
MQEPSVARWLTGMELEPVTQTIPEMQAYIEAEVRRNEELLRAADFRPE